MKPEILGRYAVTNKVSIKPNKKCMDCPFFDEGVTWCIWLKQKITSWTYNDECPIIEIIVEEQ